MKRVYNCSGLEKICDTNAVVPVFQPNRTYSLEQIERNVQCNDSLEQCFKTLKCGATIKKVYDCPENSTHECPRRVIQVKSSNNTMLSEFCLPRHVNGPVKRYSLIPFNDGEILYFSDDSHVIFLKETSRISINTADAHVTFEILYVNLKTRELKHHSFTIPKVLGLGSHILVTHGSQLFICYDNPIKLFMIDFKTMQFYTYTLEGSASRLLTCGNMVVILDNHNFPQKFMCITFSGNSVYQHFIKKHQLFLGKDKFELPMVVNVRGRILWVAQNEDILVFLKMVNGQLIVVKRFPFNCHSNANNNKMNVLIKNMFCLDSRLLFVPMIGIDKNTIGSECSADAYELVVIDLLEINILYILRTQCKVDIYTDYISMYPADRGSSVIVKKMKKSIKTGSESFTGHVFHLKPTSLKEMAIQAITTNFRYEHVKDICPPNIDLLQHYYC